MGIFSILIEANCVDFWHLGLKMDCIPKSFPLFLSSPPSFFLSLCTSCTHCQVSVVAGCLFRYTSLFLFSPAFILCVYSLSLYGGHILFLSLPVSCPNPSSLFPLLPRYREFLSLRGSSFAVSASICIITWCAVSAQAP